MVSVCLVEDDAEIREQLSKLFDGEPGFTLLNAYPDFDTAKKNLGEDQPDVLLMDIGLPGTSGIEGTLIVKSRWPAIEVVMLTVHDEDELVFESLRNGASGYLVKGTSFPKLIDAMRDVVDGGAPMSMGIARRVTESFRVQAPLEPLTRREQEVLAKLHQGHSYQAIANELFISRETVKFHIKNIYRKLHIANKYQAMKR
jgi:DNA-binding NarL/FixJ family response regulator